MLSNLLYLSIFFSVINSAGLLMTSPLDDSVFDPERRHKPNNQDLAEALSPTLQK